MGVPASTPKHGRSPKERGLSLAQWPCVRRLPTPTCAALRARAACARAVPPPMKERERSGEVALPPCETRRLIGDGRRSQHAETRPCTEGERPLAGTVALYTAPTDSNLRGAARARGMRACCASAHERERAKWRSGASALRDAALNW